MQNLPFDHLFCNFIPGQSLSGKLGTLVIEHAELSREERKSRKNLFRILRRVNGCFPKVCNQHFPADCMIFFLCFFHLRHLNLRIVLNFSMVVPFCQEISVKKCKAELCDLDKQRAQ